MSNPKYKGFFDCYKSVIREQGVSKLFNGVGVCVMRSMPVNAAGFYVFETVKK